MNKPQVSPAQAVATINAGRQPLKQTRDELIVTRTYEHRYKKDVDEAEFKQTVHREYPSRRAGNSLQDSLFGQEDFNFAPNIRPSVRVAWIEVPKGTTVEQVQKMLAKYPNAGIQKILSDQPILSAEQASALEAGLTTLDVYKYGNGDGKGSSGQLIRYPQGADLPNGGGKAKGGEPILGPTGKEQFSVNNFKLDVTAEGNQDIDLRAQPEGSNVTQSLDEEAHGAQLLEMLNTATDPSVALSGRFEVADNEEIVQPPVGAEVRSLEL